MGSEQNAKKRIGSLRPSKWTAGTAAMWLSASLLLTACVAPSPTTPGGTPTAEVEEGTATPEVSDSETMTETEDITGTEDITDTGDITGTEDVTDTEDTGDSEIITETEGITDTDTITN